MDTRRFRQVVDVFHEEVDGKPVSAMVGVIGLSTVQIVERLEYAHDVGFRMFQIFTTSSPPVISCARAFSDGEPCRPSSSPRLVPALARPF